MSGSINFRRGGGEHVKVHLPHFLSLNLFYRCPMVTFKENYHFPRFQMSGGWGGGGGGGGECTFPTKTHITCDFPGGPDPISLFLEVHIFF